MAKLTDAQLIVLSKAAQREDRAVELPSQLTARFAKALEALIERGLLEDVPSERAMPVWRHAEETNEPRGLIITELGLVAIGVIAGGAPGAGEAADDGTPAVATDTPTVAETAPKTRTPREGTKQATLIAMLRAPDGATIEEIMAATGWQSHTVRGAMAGALKKKLGLEVTSEKVEDRGRVYKLPAA